MSPKRRRLDPEKRSQFTIDMKSGQAQRQPTTYREQALALFPHVCARCGREFSGKTLRELTVHHKDSDHMNNPPDGSNWELLCIYCHDYEHQSALDGGYHAGTTQERHSDGSLDNNPFAALKDMVKPEEDNKEAK